MSTIRKAVDSSNIAELEYDTAKSVLVVTFKGTGARYRYDDFPRHAYDDLASAASVGKHFAAYVKTNYTGVRQ